MKVKKRLISLVSAFALAASLFSVTAAAATPVGEDGAKEFTLPEPLKISSGEKADIAVNMPAGNYDFSLIFGVADSTTQKAEYSVKLDGGYAFEGAEHIEARVIYEDDGGIRTLSNGDQSAPAQKTVSGKMVSLACDAEGVRLLPYTVSLSGGVHTVTVECLGNDFILYGIKLSPPEELKPYSEKTAEYSSYKNYGGETLYFEAEDILYRNDYSLTAKSDTGSSDITPKSTSNSLVNYVGGSTWSSPGQEITWEIDVPEDGLYNIGFNFKQNTIINGDAYRWLKIDGETPFKEASKIGFSYKTAWQYKTLGNEDGEAYLFYLTKGKHELSLAVTLADVADIYERLYKLCSDIGDTYLSIVMITGETPDSNRDYELYKQIPNYEETLKGYYDDLAAISNDLNSRSDINGELDGAVKNMARVCKSMHDKRYESHLYLKSYFDYYQSISSWLYDIKNMALSLDKIVLSAPETEVTGIKAGFFEKVGFSIKKFFVSFTGDYTTESLKGEDTQTLKLWVNWGRDQVKILNTLIGESFSPQTGINVKVEQVNASLVQGVISNNSPDLYLNLARTEPVNLAMRGVLYPLSEFEDYEEVLKNFQSGAEEPYIYHGKTYALPDTQGFNIMFVRDDIFERLDLEVPRTWEDFASATSVLQRKNMNSYLPYLRITAATTVNTGAGGLSIYPTMLLQSGESLYNDELNATNLNSAGAVSVFKLWTDFYSKYKLNPDINFYQRFRVGNVPLGITSYSQYLTFAVAAPEIANKWSIELLPGIEREDGTVDYTSAGSGTGCSIMNSSKNKDAAWEFIKWWVSADTQYSYSFNCEAVLGQSGRVTTSNVEALKRLSWDSKSLEVIMEQWANVKELPEVPGSYYVSRSIDQAFWAVYNNEATPKEALNKWTKSCNSEIERKIEEYADKK